MIRSDGTIGGFGGDTGLDTENIQKKIRMLKREGVEIEVTTKKVTIDSKCIETDLELPNGQITAKDLNTFLKEMQDSRANTSTGLEGL